MSFPIQTQSQQFAGFEADPAKYALRDRVAVFDVDADVHDYLAGPQITAGLLNTRTAGAYTDPSLEREYEPSPVEENGWDDYGIDAYDAHNDPARFSPDGSPYPDVEPGPPHAMGAGHYEDYDPTSAENLQDHFDNPPPTPPLRSRSDMADWDLPSFNTARRLNSDGGPDHEHTAFAVAPAQPAPPADPVWLGHTYVPGHRVGMPWRGQTLPGTVTHLEGTNIGVRWDDGQHSSEEAGAIHPLY